MYLLPSGTFHARGSCVLKRVLDIVFAGAMLLMVLPLLLVCALLVRLESEGPALFRQTRMGRGFRTFEILKLRTMCEGEPGTPITLGIDPRITRVGAWLRRRKLDEFPQLWNVLRGDMSLVGPRPVIPELALEFATEYEELLKGRPGLTDPASVEYCHEAEMLADRADPLRCFKSVVVPDKLRISRNYLNSANTLRDLAVIVKTPAVVLIPTRPGALSLGLERLHPPVCPPAMSQD